MRFLPILVVIRVVYIVNLGLNACHPSLGGGVFAIVLLPDASYCPISTICHGLVGQFNRAYKSCGRAEDLARVVGSCPSRNLFRDPFPRCLLALQRPLVLMKSSPPLHSRILDMPCPPPAAGAPLIR